MPASPRWNENMRVRGRQPAAGPWHATQVAVAVAPLAAAELARLEKAIDAAYKIFQEVRTKYADTPTAQQARGEILVMIGYWRGLTEWERSATLAVRFLADNPRDPQLPQLRLEVARDRLAWAAKPIGKPLTRQELLAEVAARFAAARTELNKIVADFVKQRALQQEAAMGPGQQLPHRGPGRQRRQSHAGPRPVRAGGAGVEGRGGQVSRPSADRPDRADAVGHRPGDGEPGLRGRIGAGVERTGHLRSHESAGPAGHRQDRADVSPRA